MKKTENDLKVFAAKQLASIYEVQDYERILEALQIEDPSFQPVPSALFGLEFLGARLAMACHAWQKSCEENQYKDETSKNIFFRTVMQSFQSPKVVNIAASFSEYLHAPAAEEKSVLSVCALLMQRLGLSQHLRRDGQAALPPGFRLLIDAGEGFKNSFENEFFEFVVS